MKLLNEMASSPNKQWYFTQAQVAKHLGCCRQTAAEFLHKHKLEYRIVGKRKRYFLGEIVEATESTRCAE